MIINLINLVTESESYEDIIKVRLEVIDTEKKQQLEEE